MGGDGGKWATVNDHPTRVCARAVRQFNTKRGNRLTVALVELVVELVIVCAASSLPRPERVCRAATAAAARALSRRVATVATNSRRLVVVRSRRD